MNFNGVAVEAPTLQRTGRLTDMTLSCHYHRIVTPAPKRKRPLKSYPMEPDLIAGLAKLSAREHLPVSALVRRAIRRELEQEGVLTRREARPSRVRKQKGKPR
jgi:hypothetical protein